MSGNPFENFETVDPNGGTGVYFQEGVYPCLEIESCKYLPAEKAYKGSDAFIARLLVVESQVPSRPAGTIIDYVLKKKLPSGEPNPFYEGNIKRLLMAAEGVEDPADVDGAYMAMVIDPVKQVARGKRLSAVATNTKTKKGGDFTNVAFKHLPAAGKAA